MGPKKTAKDAEASSAKRAKVDAEAAAQVGREWVGGEGNSGASRADGPQPGGFWTNVHLLAQE